MLLEKTIEMSQTSLELELNFLLTELRINDDMIDAEKYIELTSKLEEIMIEIKALQKKQVTFEDIDLNTIDIVIEETALEVIRNIEKEKFDNSNEFDNYDDFLEAYEEIIFDEIRQKIIFRLSQVENREEMILELEALKRSKYNRYSRYTNLQAIIDVMSIELKLID